MSFASITLCVASQQVFILVVVNISYHLSPETFGYTFECCEMNYISGCHHMDKVENHCPTLNPCSRALFEKLTIAQSVNKFPAFYGSLSFITRNNIL
jgi:hypothetical protein